MRTLARILRRIADRCDPPAIGTPERAGRELDMPRQCPVEQIVNKMAPLAFESELGEIKPRPDRPAQLPGRGFYDWRAGNYL